MFKKIGVGDLSSSSSTYRSLLLGIALSNWTNALAQMDWLDRGNEKSNK